MPDAPAPGEICYAAYCAYGAQITKAHATPWSWLASVEHQQWEAAAQAVLAQWWRDHEAIICGDAEEAPDV